MLDLIRSKARGTAAVTLFAFTALAVAPAAQAGIVGTQTAFDGTTISIERAKLAETLTRADVRAAFVAQGVDPAAVDARVASLSDDEVRTLNQRMDQLPAGGDVLGTIVVIFLVLLITDLLGWTHVFPFTNKGAIK
jgi:hypothetical protein